MREELRNNNSVGKKKETHNIVGLEGVGFGLDLEFLHTVGDHPFCGLEKSGGFGHIAAGVFESINNQLFLIVLNCPFKRKGREGAGLFSGLKSGRKMMGVDHLIRAEKNRSLHTILEFSHIARPMVLHEHVNGRSRYPSDFLFMFLVEFFDEIVSEQKDVCLPLPKGRDENGEYV
jgi:hypothetical protein